MPKVLGKKPPRARLTRSSKPFRTPPTERGYDARWTRYSKRYRQRNPFCVRCLENGRTTLIVEGATGVVDHKRPITEGGAMWDELNHWGLCTYHHSGWKAQLERYARETGQMDRIIAWCDDPTQRPKFRGDTS
ncbi:HNH endonuclease [Microvirga massiliensis]|uniref:HNH endonuclease n=1 Tax=Microvirga massiliensis TaxID=1033741 RepID=UPI000660DDC4|nr:HNH endonuclease [Microvirga massiliensis]